MSGAYNLLVNLLLDDDRPTWEGEILIVKCNVNGQPVDLTNDGIWHYSLHRSSFYRRGKVESHGFDLLSQRSGMWIAVFF